MRSLSFELFYSYISDFLLSLSYYSFSAMSSLAITSDFRVFSCRILYKSLFFAKNSDCFFLKASAYLSIWLPSLAFLSSKAFITSCFSLMLIMESLRSFSNSPMTSLSFWL